MGEMVTESELAELVHLAGGQANVLRCVHGAEECEFIRYVNEYLADGWRLHGDPIVIHHNHVSGYQISYRQFMVR